MAMLGNLIWFLFLGGLFTAVAWFVAGLLMMATVVGIPFSYAAFRIGRFAAFPFGKELVDARLLGDKRIPGTMLVNIIWFVLAGVWLTLSHVFGAIACVLSCVLVFPLFLGAPAWAIAHLHLAQASLAPMGKRVVSAEVASEARKAQIQARLGAAKDG